LQNIRTPVAISYRMRCHCQPTNSNTLILHGVTKTL